MADFASIRTNVTSAIAALGSGIAASDMVKLLDVAIANSLMYGKPIASISIDGRSHSLALSTAQSMREYYRQRSIEEDNDDAEVFGQAAEFYDNGADEL